MGWMQDSMEEDRRNSVWSCNALGIPVSRRYQEETNEYDRKHNDPVGKAITRTVLGVCTLGLFT